MDFRLVAVLILAVVNAASCQRAVFPLIVDGVAPNGARVSDPAVMSDQPGKGSGSVAKEALFVLSPNSQYIKSTGNAKSCRQHSDCYSLREPDEWCSATPTAYKITEKGCFCEPARGQCVIERKGPNGNEYTDCTDKAQSRCSRGSAIALASVQDIQFSDVSGGGASNSIEHLRSGSQSKSIENVKNPLGTYVKTSAEPKSCRVHDDCYALREPDEWCPLPSADKYSDRGCFCDISSQRCLIERQTVAGNEYSDCAPKATSRCQFISGQQYADLQKVANEDQKSKSNEKRLQGGRGAALFGLLSVSPAGRYTPSSGRPKPCLSHQDCYQMREPNEWCPLPPTDRYYEKGCFCDYGRNVCAIEREVPGGSEYTDCSEKTSSTCSRS